MKLKEVPKECLNCVNKYMCLEQGSAKDRKGCLARINSAKPQKER